jgi:hypothetical protein
VRIALAVMGLSVLPLHGAQFQFGALIRVGYAGTGGSNYDFGAGPTSGALAATGDYAAYYTDGVPVAFQIQYTKATNTVTVNVGGNTVNYNPAGGAALAANAIWTLPASSFFVTAATGPFLGTSVTLSGLTLSGVTGALNILQPIQQTTLNATRGFLGGTVSANESQDIVFQADPGGDWRLNGNVTFTGLLPPPFNILGANGDDLQFGFAASASVPEPSTAISMLLGLAFIGFQVHQRRTPVLCGAYSQRGISRWFAGRTNFRS